jgi:hypothetical protein
VFSAKYYVSGNQSRTAEHKGWMRNEYTIFAIKTIKTHTVYLYHHELTGANIVGTTIFGWGTMLQVGR